MSWRVVMITKPSKLDYSMEYLTVRDVEKTVKIHLSEISVLIIENTASSITCALLSQLIAKKIKVIFCDEKRNPCSELISCYGSHDCSLKLKNQIAWSDVAKQQAWTAIVAQKIKNQALLLEYNNLEQYLMLETYLEQLEFNDETNREGHSAKVYFNALFGKTFSRSDDVPINFALNYGYSIILSCFNREVVSCGYLTQIGLFHDNMFNQFNLSCDLMEPFRPIVDNCVSKMKLNDFTSKHKHILVNLLNNETVIDSKVNTLLNAIKIYTKSVFSAIEQNDISLIEFNKLGCFISNPINLDFNNKKLITKINAFLSLNANNEFAEEFVNVNQSIFTLADKLVSLSSFDLTYDETSIDAAALIKLLSFKINTSEQSLCESLISYILFMSKYLKTEVFVISSLYVYFSTEEIADIYKTLLLNHINLLVIEQNLPPHCQKYESVYILDNDLCQIDKEVIK